MRVLPWMLALPLMTASVLADSGEAGVSEGYVRESPLPEGWPEPGPFNRVVEKHYPESRVAVAEGGGENGSFWQLFMHIQRHGIPMTAPVSMDLEESPTGDMTQASMGFLYQSTQVGTTGPDGPAVDVRDLPACRVLAYTWQGARSSKRLAKARQAIDAELKARELKAASYRLFGYNSPFIPREKQTWEIQAVLPGKDAP